jgi:sugar phosphate isomerase/epimerase
MPNVLPVIGAAMTVPSLERHHNWLLEGQRDLELQDFIDAEVLDGDWRPVVARARQLLSGHTGRLGIHGPFWGFAIDTPDPAVRAVVQHRLDQGLDVCAALGATNMVVHSPFTTWDTNNLDAKPGARQAKQERCHLAMAPAVRRAETLGVTLVIENIQDKNPRDRVDLALSFNSPAVAVSLDTGHAHYAHGSAGAPPVDYYILAAGKHLAHVHLQDADGFADRHWPPGEGTIRWHAIFAALRAIDANPRLVLELADESRIREGADWLVAQGLGR